ncbi:hypothetical protein EVAR_58033_1 [Eumeta japonica]|uniref:EGF-like domain-containing protein n=1 Tax=Eumeta variegata TaxID=151549 RepID=A0A4C1ZIS1_EUMVA|nr:hypothetical protein EVAR_58033_1 [Eumeta japonica]
MEGYSGADCGVGPLCPRAANTCHHGGTCRSLLPTTDETQGRSRDKTAGIDQQIGCDFFAIPLRANIERVIDNIAMNFLQNSLDSVRLTSREDNQNYLSQFFDKKSQNFCSDRIRQMGPAAVSCLCAPGYTGDLCESQLATPECGIEECSEECRDSVCDCNPKDDDFTSARFETKLQVADQQNFNVSQEILTQAISEIIIATKAALSYCDCRQTPGEADSAGARSVWLRIWGARREAGAVRTALARLAASIRPKSKLRFLHTNLYFDMQPALTLHVRDLTKKKTSPLAPNNPNERRATCKSLIVLGGRGGRAGGANRRR